jgi:hypothetical protein
MAGSMLLRRPKTSWVHYPFETTIFHVKKELERVSAVGSQRFSAVAELGGRRFDMDGHIKSTVDV